MKKSIFNIFGVKSESKNDNLNKSKSVTIMYLNKTLNELTEELIEYGELEKENIEFDVKCIEDVIKYLQK
ncbi:MAG TPA: hypothetical protein VIK26_09775 [Clostridium sp.]